MQLKQTKLKFPAADHDKHLVIYFPAGSVFALISFCKLGEGVPCFEGLGAKFLA
jgi:hypothetical protein